MGSVTLWKTMWAMVMRGRLSYLSYTSWILWDAIKLSLKAEYWKFNEEFYGMPFTAPTSSWSTDLTLLFKGWNWALLLLQNAFLGGGETALNKIRKFPLIRSLYSLAHLGRCKMEMEMSSPNQIKIWKYEIHQIKLVKAIEGRLGRHISA